MRPARGLGRLEPGRAPVQPVARAAALRPRAGLLRAGRRGAGPAQRRRVRGHLRARGLPGRGRRRGRRGGAAGGLRGRRGAARPARRRRRARAAAAGAVARPARGRPATAPGAATSSTSSATPPSPTCGARPARACARPSTSSATRRSAPAPTRARRPNVTTLGVLAGDARGRHRGARHDDVPAAVHAGRRSRCSRAATAASCTTRPHDAHPRVARGAGAVFEDVGQWKRPWYYPRDGEDMDAAVLRECRAAREGVAVMDASTLGKIDVHGPGRRSSSSNRMYTGDFAKLAVGACQYGLLCGADGMVFDDGVVDAPGRGPLPGDHDHRQRGGGAGLAGGVAADRVAGAARAAAPRSPSSGPRSRSWGRARATCCGALAPDLDVGREGFPFMAMRETRGGRHPRARVPGRASPASWRSRSTWPGRTAWRCGRP